MAGVGSRFLREGYLLPKTLIPVSGVPMVINAIRGMPKSNKWIFIVRQEHIDDYGIDLLLKKEIPDAIIIPVSKTTEGQLCTCLLAETYLEPDESVFIAACDNICLYNLKKYERLCNQEDIDCIVWTFTKSETLKCNPSAFGWCVLEDDNLTVKNMSIKKPVSNNPYYDHAVVASFFFKRAKDFIESANLMIKENYRINNEFYVDAIPIFLKKLNKRSVIFDVDLFLSWNSPKDLYYYQKMEYLCKYGIKALDILTYDKDKITLWKKYFKIDKL